MKLPIIRRGQAPPKLSDVEFRERFMARFADTTFDGERSAIERLCAIALDNYRKGRKAPHRTRAGAEFHDPDRTDEGYWEVRWHDVAAGDLCWHEPLARIELEDGTVVADDQGTRMAVLQLKSGTYSARWYGPPLGRVPKHRFVLPANAGQPEIRTELFG